MRRLRRAVFALLLAGCGSAKPQPGDPAKKVTWDEYQQMDAEQKDDPYVVDNLSDDAKQKLAASQKQKKKR